MYVSNFCDNFFSSILYTTRVINRVIFTTYVKASNFQTMTIHTSRRVLIYKSPIAGVIFSKY